MSKNVIINLHNEKTKYQVLLNNRKLNIYVKRIRTIKTFYTQLISRKIFNYNEGFFIHKTNGFATYMFNFPVDLIFVNFEEKIIKIIPNFQSNKISNYYPDVKFCYIFPEKTIKNNNIQINDLLKHQRIKTKKAN